MKTSRFGWIGPAVAWAVAALALATAPDARSGVVTWTNTAGAWAVGGNWDGGSVPGAGDDVFITNAGASVVLSGDQTILSLTLGKTLTFTNWNTTLTASNIVVQTNGIVTHAGPFTTQRSPGPSPPACSTRAWATDCRGCSAVGPVAGC